MAVKLNTLRWTIWFAYSIQFSLSVAVLGLAGNEAWKLNNELRCQTLPKLEWNIICAAISVVGLSILLFVDRPFHTDPLLRLNISFFNKQNNRTLICLIFLILWLAAAATSTYTCPELCGSCPAAEWLVYAGKFCPCTADAETSAGEGSIESTSNRVGDYEHKRGLNIALTIFFAVLVFLSVLVKWAAPNALTSTISDTEQQHFGQPAPIQTIPKVVLRNRGIDGDDVGSSKTGLPTYVQAMKE